MSGLTQQDLFSLEEYARVRPSFRAKVMTHKRQRRLALGSHVSLCFEDALTMQYQVQEMLRLERIFEPELIQDELDVYNPLIPSGHNWKATLMIEYDDINVRRVALARLVGIEQAVWLQVAGFERIEPIANEDLQRSTPDKTAAVHFLRFELSPAMAAAAKHGAALAAGIDHPHYQALCDPLPVALQAALVADLSEA